MNPVTYKTFEDDGYHDAIAGLEPRPPDKHNDSAVYADEYMYGYNIGRNAIYAEPVHIEK